MSMLNELLVIERGARFAGISMTLRHPEVKSIGRIPTMHVFLDEKGCVTRVKAFSQSRLDNRSLWKLSEGQKNSFPFIQPKPFCNNDTILLWKKLEKKTSDFEKRKVLLELISNSTIRSTDLGEWTSKGMMKSLRKRRQQLVPFENSNFAALPATCDRFLIACDKDYGGDPALFTIEIVHKIIEELTLSANSDFLTTSISIFIKGGGLYFDAEGDFPFDVTDDRVQEALCQLLRENDIQHAERTGVCSLTGKKGILVSGNFSQPNLPVIQQTFLFARNEAIPSSSRYGKLSSASIPVGYMTDIALRAAFEALCSGDRRGKTWRSIPSEIPKKQDLFLSFVEKALEAPIPEALTEEDFSEEEAEPNSSISISAFEERTERLIDLIRAKVNNDLSNTLVNLSIFRAVDKANRKVVYASAPTVFELYQAAKRWVEGERNVPKWLNLPVFLKTERVMKLFTPPHVAPLGLIAFSKKAYIRKGTESQEIAGLPASETLKCFFCSTVNCDLLAEGRIKRVLRMVLTRRTMLVTGTAHALRRGFKFAKDYDRHEALRTITILGVLLHKLGRIKEVYMNEVAFKLGQLLAAADVVHVGYCADVRGGDVPPSLLGNQVFSMAQSAPNKALAILCRRWKPYDGWAKKAASEPKRAEALIASKQKDDQQRGWDIKKALRHAREMGPLAAELAQALKEYHVDDAFRAELLLGYISGFPKAQKEEDVVQCLNQKEREEG
jgi:hypothetical protein